MNCIVFAEQKFKKIDIILADKAGDEGGLSQNETIDSLRPRRSINQRIGCLCSGAGCLNSLVAKVG